jgi:hypothetical protein
VSSTLQKKTCQTSFGTKKSLTIFFLAFHSFPIDLLSTSREAQHVYFYKISNPHTFITKKKPVELLSLLIEAPRGHSCNHSSTLSSSLSFLVAFALLHVNSTLQKTNPPSFSQHRKKFNEIFFATIHSFHADLLLTSRFSWCQEKLSGLFSKI